MTGALSTFPILLTQKEHYDLDRLMQASCERNAATAILSATQVFSRVLALMETYGLFPYFSWECSDFYHMKEIKLNNITATFDESHNAERSVGYFITVPEKVFQQSVATIASNFNLQAEAPEVFSQAVVLALNFGTIILDEMAYSGRKTMHLVSALQGSQRWSAPQRVFMLPYDATLEAKFGRLAHRVKYIAQDTVAQFAKNRLQV